MAAYLLDTHTAIWFFEENKLLSGNDDSLIRNTSNEIIISITSLWEIAIKTNIKKLKLEATLDEFVGFCADNNFRMLHIQLRHLNQYILLEISHHRDPFDKLLIATAQVDNLTIITNDKKFEDYPVNLIW